MVFAGLACCLPSAVISGPTTGCKPVLCGVRTPWSYTWFLLVPDRHRLGFQCLHFSASRPSLQQDIPVATFTHLDTTPPGVLGIPTGERSNPDLEKEYELPDGKTITVGAPRCVPLLAGLALSTWRVSCCSTRRGLQYPSAPLLQCDPAGVPCDTVGAWWRTPLQHTLFLRRGIRNDTQDLGGEQ